MTKPQPINSNTVTSACMTRINETFEISILEIVNNLHISFETGVCYFLLV